MSAIVLFSFRMGFAPRKEKKNKQTNWDEAHAKLWKVKQTCKRHPCQASQSGQTHTCTCRRLYIPCLYLGIHAERSGTRLFFETLRDYKLHRALLQIHERGRFYIPLRTSNSSMNLSPLEHLTQLSSVIYWNIPRSLYAGSTAVAVIPHCIDNRWAIV